VKAVQKQLDALARQGAAQHQVFLRVAGVRDTLWLDLANPEGEVVEITAEGFRVVPGAQVPVKFARPRGMAPLPRPASRGDFHALRELLNVSDDGLFRLIVTWLAYTLVAEGTYPVLAVAGPAGAAKSTFTAILKKIADPNTSPMYGVPQGRDLTAIARNNHLIALDNLSNVTPTLADNLCRLATGGSFGGRALYTNYDMAMFHAQRPIILNGINDLITRGDLADRSIVVHLERIDPRQARSKQEIWDTLDAALPEILSALLNIVVQALRQLPNVKMPPQGLPRMVDFAKFGIAAAPTLGWGSAEFLSAYSNNRHAATEIVLDDDPVASGVLELVETRPSKQWIGSVAELFAQLEARAPNGKLDAAFPKTASALGKQLERLKPALEERYGLLVEKPRRTGSKRVITLRMARTLSAVA